jgi:outer membrane protein assembly factor BamB
MQRAVSRYPLHLPLRLLRVLALALLAQGGALSAARGDDWPQWLGPQRDGVWRETGILKQFPKDGPKVRWRTPIGPGYAGPAVAHGRVYVTDRVLAQGVRNPDSGFTPRGSTFQGGERVLCLDEATGKVLWQHEYECTYAVAYPAGPRTTPLVHDGKVYTLGTMGDLRCLDAATGKLLWKKNFVTDYEGNPSQWGFSAHPLLDGNKLICLVGARNKIVTAFHKDTGEELWGALSGREPGYCPPMIYEAGSKRQLIVCYPEAISSLDPETGKTYWSEKCNIQAGLTIPTPRRAGDQLFVTTFYNGSIMFQLDPAKPAASVLWKGKWFDATRSGNERPDRTDGMHSIICTPVLQDGYIYGVCSYGELRCLKADTGERVWMTLRATGSAREPEERWANAFLVPHEDRFFLPNEKGDLIIARLTPQGYQEISRAHILEPDNRMPGRRVNWSHPAFANRSMYARNDHEIVCVSLAAAE